MSGGTALESRFDRGPIGSCSQEESELCRRLTCTFVRCAGAVAVGEKPAAIFSFQPRTCPHDCAVRPTAHPCVRSVVAGLAVGLSAHGVCLQVLGERGGRLELMAWRPDLVGRLLADVATCSFLAQRGYDVSTAGSLVSGVRRRLVDYHRGGPAGFPHEVGVLLGYPLEDVKGYLAGDRETCRGLWRAYGDVREARARFERVRDANLRCRRRFAEGATLAQVLS